MVSGEKCGGEAVEGGVQDFEAAGIERAEAVFASDDVERGSLLGAGFGPEKRAGGKIECGETARWRNFDAARLRAERVPMQAAGDHQVEDEPEFAFEADADAFAETPELENSLAGGVGEGRVCRAQKKWADDADTFKDLAEDAAFQGFDINDDVREFRHVFSKLVPQFGAESIVHRARILVVRAAQAEWWFAEASTRGCRKGAKKGGDWPYVQAKIIRKEATERLHIQK